VDVFLAARMNITNVLKNVLGVLGHMNVNSVFKNASAIMIPAHRHLYKNNLPVYYQPYVTWL